MRNLFILFMFMFIQNLLSQDSIYINNSVWIGKTLNGKRHGYCEEYRNETLLSKGYFKHDIKEGKWTYYGLIGGKYPEMDVIATGNYTNGEKEGLWEYYQSLLYWKGIYKNEKKQKKMFYC